MQTAKAEETQSLAELVMRTDLREGTGFCYFYLLPNGIRIVACATWTSYQSDFTVSPEEAKACYERKIADGYKVHYCGNPRN